MTTYSEKDYQSNDGMLVSVWGPSQWHFLHTISFNYPMNPTELQKKKYRDYMLNLKYVLPCGKCRKNLVENYRKLPLHMSHMKSRYTFSKYVYDLHELINEMLHKKSGLTYDMVRERYEHFRARCSKTKSNKTKSNKTKSNNHPKKQTSGYLSKTRRRKEKGCTEPLVGEKSKCILKIVPEKTKCDTFSMDKKCIKIRE
jgi:hypothetical protein